MGWLPEIDLESKGRLLGETRVSTIVISPYHSSQRRTTTFFIANIQPLSHIRCHRLFQARRMSS